MRWLLLLSLCFLASPGFAKLKVVGTTTDVSYIVREVGGAQIEVSTIAKGTQDPHYIETKPSYMVKLRDADLVVSNGLSLEIGWLPSLIRGARNPRIVAGSSGYLELGSLIQPLEVPQGKITRAMGDIHPEGNPHFTLDPVRVGEAALGLAQRLGELDIASKALYHNRAVALQKRLTDKSKVWQERVNKAGVKSVITYHPSMNYFLFRFGIKPAAYLEPKPGVPPTAKHIVEMIAKMKTESVTLILVDNFFDLKIADRVQQGVPGAKVKSVGIGVESAPGLASLEDVVEQLVQTVEGKR